jgi:hypothetical protein
MEGESGFRLLIGFCLFMAGIISGEMVKGPNKVTAWIISFGSFTLGFISWASISQIEDVRRGYVVTGFSLVWILLSVIGGLIMTRLAKPR